MGAALDFSVGLPPWKPLNDPGMSISLLLKINIGEETILNIISFWENEDDEAINETLRLSRAQKCPYMQDGQRRDKAQAGPPWAGPICSTKLSSSPESPYSLLLCSPDVYFSFSALIIWASILSFGPTVGFSPFFSRRKWGEKHVYMSSKGLWFKR